MSYQSEWVPLKKGDAYESDWVPSSTPSKSIYTADWTPYLTDRELIKEQEKILKEFEENKRKAHEIIKGTRKANDEKEAIERGEKLKAHFHSLNKKSNDSFKKKRAAAAKKNYPQNPAEFKKWVELMMEKGVDQRTAIGDVRRSMTKEMGAQKSIEIAQRAFNLMFPEFLN